MELDNSHLKKQDNIFKGKRDRVCFIPADLRDYESHLCDTMEEALEKVFDYGSAYKEYTVIPRVFITLHD